MSKHDTIIALLIFLTVFPYDVFSDVGESARDSMHADHDITLFFNRLTENPKDCVALTITSVWFQSKAAYCSSIIQFQKAYELCDLTATDTLQMSISHIVIGNRERGTQLLNEAKAKVGEVMSENRQVFLNEVQSWFEYMDSKDFERLAKHYRAAEEENCELESIDSVI